MQPVAPVVLPPRAAYSGPVQVVDGRLMNGTTPLTDRFPHIDSFSVSETRREVIFSAQKESGYDIGLAAIDGSQVNWLPPDPADETNAVWAPRGNKVSYFVRTKAGDFVRTVHIPTAFSLSVEFPFAMVHDLAWEPQAERYTVVVSSAVASPYVEELRYGGEERRTTKPPAIRIDGEPEAFGPEAMVVRPTDLRYNEKLPVVIWQGEPKGWNDARGSLMRNTRVAMVIARTIDDALYTRVAETKWMDPSRIFVVAPTSNQQPATSNQPATRNQQPITITTDGTIPPHTYMIKDRRVLTAPADIESFSAGYIADQLKRTTAPHGSSR